MSTTLLEKAEKVKEGAGLLYETMLEQHTDKMTTHTELTVEATDFIEICNEKNYQLDKYIKARKLFQYDEKMKETYKISEKLNTVAGLFMRHSIEIEKDTIESILNRVTEEEVLEKIKELWEIAKEVEKMTVLHSKKIDPLIIFLTHWNEKLELESEKESSSCFIATAVIGNRNHPKVVALREFRDVVLLPTKLGNCFINYYYRIGPKIASLIQNRLFLRKLLYMFIVLPISIITKKMLLNRKRSNKIGNTFMS